MALDETHFSTGCIRCGATGLHACTGHPGTDWTEAEKYEFFEGIKKMIARHFSESVSSSDDNKI